MHFMAYTHSGLQKVGQRTDLIKLVVEVISRSLLKLELPSSPGGGGNALGSGFSNRQKTLRNKKTLRVSRLHNWIIVLKLVISITVFYMYA